MVQKNTQTMFSLVFKFIYATAHIGAPCTVWKSMSVCCNQIFLLRDIQCVWVYAPVFWTKLLCSVMIKVLSQHPLTWHGMACMCVQIMRTTKRATSVVWNTTLLFWSTDDLHTLTLYIQIHTYFEFVLKFNERNSLSHLIFVCLMHYQSENGIQLNWIACTRDKVETRAMAIALMSVMMMMMLVVLVLGGGRWATNRNNRASMSCAV